jgi:hypothetical protein
MFHGEELLASRPTPKLKDHPLSAVRDCLFNIFAATLQKERDYWEDQDVGRWTILKWILENRMDWYGLDRSGSG